MNTQNIATSTVERLALWEMYTGPWAHARWAVYGLGAIALIVFFTGVLKRWRAYAIGRPAPRALDHKGARFAALFRHGIAQVRLIEQPFRGLFHLMVFWGFVALFIGTVLTFVDEDLYRIITGEKLITGRFYVILSFALDLFGLLAVLGIGIAAARRYLVRPAGLDNDGADASLLVWLIAVLITGFLAEGARIGVVAAHKEAHGFEVYSFVGYGVASMLGASPFLHKLFWAAHILLSFYFIATIPHAKARHFIAALASIFTRSLGPKAKVPPIPRMIERMEAGEEVPLGIKRITDLNRRELLQTDACTRCGRCQDACPAHQTGKLLSPKSFIQSIRSNWLAELVSLGKNGPTIAEERRDRFLLQAEAASRGNGARFDISSQSLWDCTNCMACMTACPVFVEHVPLLVQMRRSLAMEFDDSEKACKDFFKNMDVNANPWGFNPSKRAAWTAEARIPSILDNPNCQTILWLGCMGGFDPRTIEIYKALAKVLNAAGVDFAVLGEMEMCCGDSLRRLGNEASFQALVALFKEAVAECEMDPAFEGKKVITACPHCFNALRHDYPEFGFEWQVFHHTEIIDELIRNGRIHLAPGTGRSAVLHDSCFLSRYNDIIAQPRSILKATGASLREVPRNEKSTFCCGGGGGRVWLEEDWDPKAGKTRINYNRADELLDADAEDIVSACPMCMMILDDAVKRDELETTMKNKRLLDIAELLADRLVLKP